MKITVETHFNRQLKVFANRPKTIIEMLERAVTAFPDKEAFVSAEERVTYREFYGRVENVAGNLSTIYGVRKGDRVGLLVGNRIEFAVLVFACARIGAIAVILNTRLKAQELSFMLNHSGASVLLFEGECFNKVETLKADITTVDHFFLIGNVATEMHTYTPYEILLQPASAPVSEILETDPLFIMYTSGTTGVPKGAIASHLGVIHGALSYECMLKTNYQTKTLIAVPLFHVTGLVGQLIHMVQVGGTSVLMDKYKTDKYIQLLAEENITFLFNVPTIYVMMMSHPDFSKYTYHAVRTLAFGGAPMSMDTILGLRKAFPAAELQNAYGATETSSPTTIMPRHVSPDKLQSVGRPIPVADVKVVDENGEECAPGEAGQLLVKGPMVIQGYWNNEEANKRSFIDGFWYSGDVAVIDKDGFVFIMDRMKDMINRGGEKVFSVEVENVLYNHPGILEAAVVGVPDKLYGETAKAFVVPNPNVEIGEEEVRQFVRERLAEYKVPSTVEFISALPRNPGGKIIKSQLKEGSLSKQQFINSTGNS
ncbi:class I adenylate-forming enzyme family protein [Aneurinibacillus sp. Ricciae_BoGa-3]|uniref:class I adenylate-forming enzyme family protein n=1 Tax=Aneurinibacillus sp. Ricciae_BoGa-3 TaxID=3022697 RepID=UPI002340E0D6|nr:class I adenylate-forming enzyme family protein [Aneurinibacillus sp. Ricciae_BoGa-3]WCK55707.1 class I adenylate-forming enzyme family protein [Aneurinibacillus sp. Ricciae_BoGa-3]